MKTFTKQILSMAALLAVYSCGPEDLGSYRCPASDIAATSDSWPQVTNPETPAYEVKLRAIRSACAAYVSGLVESDVEIAGYLDVYRSDSAPRDDFLVDVFVAAVDPQNNIVAQNIETIEIDGVNDGVSGPAGSFSHKFNELSFYTAEDFKVTSYRILVGFRLNEAQLAANRAAWERRLSPAEVKRQK